METRSRAIGWTSQRPLYQAPTPCRPACSIPSNSITLMTGVRRSREGRERGRGGEEEEREEKRRIGREKESCVLYSIGRGRKET
jgi:hypothetical protein